MAATLSIVMPVFNHPAELGVMLDSILANTYQDWELLAVDDGSEQETLSLLEQYAGKDDRIRSIRRELQPKGAQTCRNTGLDIATGEFIVFFDSDDYVAPYCFKQRVNEMKAHPNLDFMVFRSGIFRDGRYLTKPDKNIYGCPIYKDDLAAFCARTLPFIVWNNIYRRDALLLHSIRWDTRLLSLQDAQFNLECILSGMSYAHSSCPPDYGYRMGRVGSISKKILSSAHYESNLYATERFYELVQAHNGHSYDRMLSRGAHFIYVKVSRTGFKADFNKRLAAIVRKHSPCYGLMFTTQIYLTRILSLLLPLGMARRIPIFGYLLWYRRWEKWVVRQQNKLL